MPLVRLFALLGAVLTGLLLTAGAAVASGPYTPGGGQLVLSTATAAPGDEVTASASGYGPQTEVRIVAGGAEAAGGTTDAEGAFAVPFTVPDVDAGPLEIRAIGVDADGATMVLMAVLTVTGDEPVEEPTEEPTGEPSDVPSDQPSTEPAEPGDEPGDGASTDPAAGPAGEETADTGAGLGAGIALVAAAVAAGGLLLALAARRRRAAD